MPSSGYTHRRRPTAPGVGFRSRRRSATGPRPLVDLVAAALQTRGHRAVVVIASRVGIALNSAGRLRRIEAGLALRPIVAFELVCSLLFLGLTILGVNHQIALRA